MPKAKFKIYFQKMLDDNRALFEKFKKLHDEYGLNENKFQKKFNDEGEKVLEVIREYENRLCANTERGIYNKFSTALAEKFQNEVRTHFPLIDHIGLVVETPQLQKTKSFTIKKINCLG
jgi:sugar-specific transcriptional regulator TrmB